MTLQHTSTHYNTLRNTTPHCNILQHTATHCNTLQHTATHCYTLQQREADEAQHKISALQVVHAAATDRYESWKVIIVID